MENLMEVPAEPKHLKWCPWRDVNTEEDFVVNKESLGSRWALLSVQMKFWQTPMDAHYMQGTALALGL